MEMDLLSITRTAAMIYAEENLGNRKTETIRRKFVESIFVLRENKSMTIMTIIDALEEELSITYSEQEVLTLIKENDSFEYIAGKTKEEDMYRLTGKRYVLLQDRSSDVIQNTFEKFLVDKDIPSEKFGHVMQQYLYYLLNTNIEAFGGILKGSMPDVTKDLLVSFSDEDIQIINDFLNWKDNDKNIALYKLISYCIEYAIAVNNSKESVLTSAIKNKDFYLDNALLYRALGINGAQRKKRTLSFLKKCIETGQSLHVTCISRHEFMETIDFHINQIRKTTPFGNINPAVFRRIMSGSFCQYYHEWRKGRIQYGFELFKSNIVSEYNQLIEQYNIKEEFAYPFPEEANIQQIEDYREGIKSVKTRSGSSKSEALHLYDAQNIYWIEQLRGYNNKTVEHTKYYFITSDLKLHAWDTLHSPTSQPVTLQPSQWMALLLKYTSRTTDDFNSFVSFLNIPREPNVVSETDLQYALAGISEITEDLKQQDYIVSTMFASNLKKMQESGDVRSFAKAFAKDEMEKVYLERLNEKTKEIELIKSQNSENIEKLKKEWLEEMQKRDEENRKREEKMRKDFEASMVRQEIASLKVSIGSLESDLCNKDQFLSIAKSKANFQSGLLRLFCGLIVLATLFYWVYYIIKGDWNKLEPITYVIGIVPLAIEILCMMVLGKAFNPMHCLENFSEYRYKKECAKYGVTKTTIEGLKCNIEEKKALLKNYEEVQSN